MKLCVATVVSDDSYQGYVPMFLYCLNRAFPGVDAKVFVRGHLNAETCDALQVNKGSRIYQDCFRQYMVYDGTLGALRFVLDEKLFRDYDYVFITDADMLIFNLKEYGFGPFWDQYVHKIKNIGIPIAAVRGALKLPRRANICNGWDGDYTRVMGGYVMLKMPDWYDACGKAVKKYRYCLENARPDKTDNYVAGLYREYDEVMLGRICRSRNIPVHAERGRFPDGAQIHPHNRFIHLGDFRSNKLIRQKAYRLTTENFAELRALRKDNVWNEIVKLVGKRYSNIKDVMLRANRYADARVKC